MKKLILLILIAAVTMSPLANAAVRPAETTLQATPSHTATATHVVCLEEGTEVKCGYCPTAAAALKSLYEDEGTNHSFYYVALVYDRSSISQKRFYSTYGGRAFPSVFIDGGFSQQVGVGTTVNQTKSQYQTLITTAGERDVHDVSVNTSVVGHSNAKLDITIKMTNNGNSFYIGILKSFVTEITSRWNDAQHNPYHFALLDFAFKKLIILSPHKTKELSVTWNGAANHGNNTFADIQDDNIMVISSLAHWMPHQIPAEQYVKAHYAFFVDQTDAAIVSTE